METSENSGNVFFLLMLAGANKNGVKHKPKPQTVKIEKELSGAQWCSRFQGSNDISELEEPFQTNFRRFLRAMHQAGIDADIQSIYRPPQRSYLMHYSKQIANGICAESIPDFEPRGDDEKVVIDWVHRDASGNYDQKASKKAAQDMMNLYQTSGNPVAKPYTSRHNSRPSNAVDINMSSMTIPSDCIILDANGNSVLIEMKSDLYAVGKTYGVLKLESDIPHWSNDGH